ncbi:hypothetical protein BC830DRAFT_1140934 [Chytriomyces sp. MP71]|nr:hypothetical protein BC830DRAFT_1140934 [Chytriomyces sp. MP71]
MNEQEKEILLQIDALHSFVLTSTPQILRNGYRQMTDFTLKSPTELIQQIFSHLPPEENILLKSVNRRVYQSLTSIAFASQNVARFSPRQLATETTAPDALDRGLFKWPEEYRYAIVEAKLKQCWRVEWYARWRLQGTLGPALAGLTSLQVLDLGENQLVGAIPREIGSLVGLQRLNLARNALSGVIPSELGNLIGLWYLALNGNQLSMSIPKELGNLTNLETLYLGGNKLSGMIPAELGSCAGLQILQLNSNLLRGGLPKEFEALTKLQVLYLQQNRLEGELPAELGGMANLKEFDVSFNNLSGRIPEPVQVLPNLSTFYQKGNKLTVNSLDRERMLRIRKCDV